MVGDVFTQIQFSTSISDSDIHDILAAAITAHGSSGAPLLSIENPDPTDPDPVGVVLAGDFDDITNKTYINIINNSEFGYNVWNQNDIVYQGTTYPAGWQGNFTVQGVGITYTASTRVLSAPEGMTLTIASVNADANGVLFGKVAG